MHFPAEKGVCGGTKASGAAAERAAVLDGSQAWVLAAGVRRQRCFSKVVVERQAFVLGVVAVHCCDRGLSEQEPRASGCERRPEEEQRHICWLNLPGSAAGFVEWGVLYY